MFVDASAIVAIIARETGWLFLSKKLASANTPLTSSIAVFESALAIARLGDGNLDRARMLVATFCANDRIETLAIGADVGSEALNAHARFGKGRHPAKLNMSDCFAYACAKVHKVPLLCKGDHFSQTDIQVA